MAHWCLFLAVFSPFSLALGWFLVSYSPGGTIFTGGNLPSLILMALSPLAFFASAVIGVRRMLVGERTGAGWVAAGLVLDYCWFHFVCAIFIIQQIRGR